MQSYYVKIILKFIKKGKSMIFLYSYRGFGITLASASTAALQEKKSTTLKSLHFPPSLPYTPNFCLI